MSDYIKRQDVIDLINGLDSLPWEEETEELVNGLPTIDEKEIIRKSFERVVERLEGTKWIAFLTLANTGNKMKDIVYYEVMAYLNTAIEIVKEECGINE